MEPVQFVHFNSHLILTSLCTSVGLNECVLNDSVIPPAELLADSKLLITLHDFI